MFKLLSSKQQSQRQMINSGISPSLFNLNHLSSIPSGVTTYSADVSKDHRHQQFLLTMRQHREQLVVYLDSLKQALNSLERLASLEPTQNEIHLANMK